MRKFGVLAILVLLIFFVMVIALNSNDAVRSKITSEIDESNKWVRHEIATSVSGHTVSLATGDINQDAKEDVLIVLGIRNIQKPTDGIWWFESPDWQIRRISDPEMPIRWGLALTAGDVDNDGDLDVVALSFNDSNVYLSINPHSQGDDIYTPWQTIRILDSPGIHRDGERVEIVDIDQDGYKDVLFIRGRPREVRVLFNPSGVPSALWTNKLIGHHKGVDAHDVLYADIDLDGDLDIVAASGDASCGGVVYWYEHPDGEARSGRWVRHSISMGKLGSEILSLVGRLRFRFGLHKNIGCANYGGLQIDDIDKDGRPDVLVTEAHGIPGKIMWYKNPTTSKDRWTRFDIDEQNFPHAALTVDVDGDGAKEVWVPDGAHEGDRAGGIVYYKIIDANKNEWSKHIVAFPPSVGRQSRAVDMDGDGDMDVVSTADHHMLISDSIVWWENKLNESY